MKKKYLIIIFLLAIFSCKNSNNSAHDQAAAAAYDAQFPAAEDTVWNYRSDVDKMTDDTTHTAEVSAKNKLHFDSPYDGGVTAKLHIRKDSTTDVFLTIEKGIFIISSNGGNKIKCRFDKDKAVYFAFSPTSDHSSNIIFISDRDKFLAQVRKHKSLIIEAEFYREGFKQMEFNISDLKFTK